MLIKRRIKDEEREHRRSDGNGEGRELEVMCIKEGKKAIQQLRGIKKRRKHR